MNLFFFLILVLMNIVKCVKNKKIGGRLELSKSIHGLNTNRKKVDKKHFFFS